MYGAWLNPKHFKMENQQPSLEQRKAQRLSLGCEIQQQEYGSIA